jgi:alpha-L-fucosidase
MYAVYALPDGESLPATIEWTGNVPKGQVKILNTGKNARYKVENGRVTVFLKGKMKDEPVALEFRTP